VKAVAGLVGLETALLAYLGDRGVISVHWSRLSQSVTGAGALATPVPSMVATGLAATGVDLRYLGGFALGFHRG